MTNVFEFSEVSFSYSGSNPLLEKFSLAIEKGSFVAIVGPNGAGKSTLLKICVGLLRPQSGHVRILGMPFQQFDNWSKIGYIPQGTFHNMIFPATVREVVAMGRVAPLGIGKRLSNTDYEMIDEALAFVGLVDYKSSMIAELSGGQLQRALIARTLAAKPEILILDEATSGVDSKAKNEIYALLKDMNSRLGLSIIMVSHDVDQVLPYVDKVASINRGLDYYGDAHGFCAKNVVQQGNDLFDGNRGKLLHA